MPGTCEETSTPCEAMSVPIAGSRSTHLSLRAASAVTVAGGGTCWDRNSLIIFGLKTYWKYDSPPRKTATMTRAMINRLIMAIPVKRAL